jgi:hypothetical protein
MPPLEPRIPEGEKFAVEPGGRSSVDHSEPQRVSGLALAGPTAAAVVLGVLGPITFH